MKFKTFEIENYKAITHVKLSNLNDVILIAGPNGCGKSAIFDAIRLFKSMYGEYQANELNSWFNEFQISSDKKNFSSANQLSTHFQNPNKQTRFYAELVLASEEISWLKENIIDLASYSLLRKKIPRNQGPNSINISEEMKTLSMLSDQEIDSEISKLNNGLNREFIAGEIIFEPSKPPVYLESTILENIFSLYLPNNIGVIDYHGPQRDFSRERVGSINLNFGETSSQHALYNYSNKYKNIKNELASSFVMELIAKKAGENLEGVPKLEETLKELFNTFIPDKEFLGPKATKDGKITYNVKTSYGAIHDIDELSSGEKEVLYGYLRIRNSGFKNSVLFIDEPELHLNPKLVQGLPLFYHRHIGKTLNNQIWLVTHSDALLRQSIGNENFNVYHLQKPENLVEGENQAKEISASEELEKAIIDLVGDLPSYIPGAKLVIVEGGGDSDFDIHMIRRLFPSFESKVNLVSGGGKKKIRNLHELLEKARKSGLISIKVYSIADKDFESDGDNESQPLENNFFIWDRFHIENYLLESKYILKALNDIRPKNLKINTEHEVEDCLKKSAEKTMHFLVRGIMEHSTNQKLVKCIRTYIDRQSDDLSGKLLETINSSIERLNSVIKEDLSDVKIKEIEENLRKDYKNDLNSGNWKLSFRGRDILKDFVNSHLKGAISYDCFCSLIITKMVDEDYQPEGMKKVLDKILNN